MFCPKFLTSCPTHFPSPPPPLPPPNVCKMCLKYCAQFEKMCEECDSMWLINYVPPSNTTCELSCSGGVTHWDVTVSAKVIASPV